MINVPYVRQIADHTCGPAALAMMLAYWRKPASQQQLIRQVQTTEYSGTTRKNLIRAARAAGLYTHSHSNASYAELRSLVQQGIPVLVNYREPEENTGHYGVVVAATASHLLIHDPYHGPAFKMPTALFQRRWHGTHHSVNRRWLLAAQAKPFDPKLHRFSK